MNIKNRSKVNVSKGKKQRKTKVSRKKAKKQKGGASEGTLINEDEKLALNLKKLLPQLNNYLYEQNAIKKFIKKYAQFSGALNYYIEKEKFNLTYNKPTEVIVNTIPIKLNIPLNKEKKKKKKFSNEYEYHHEFEYKFKIAASRFNTYVFVDCDPVLSDPKDPRYHLRHTMRIIKINGEDFTKGTAVFETNTDQTEFSEKSNDDETRLLEMKLNEVIKKAYTNTEIKIEYVAYQSPQYTQGQRMTSLVLYELFEELLKPAKLMGEDGEYIKDENGSDKLLILKNNLE